MLKKYIIYIPLILLLLVGGLYVFKHRESNINSRGLMVLYNESGEKELDFFYWVSIKEVPLCSRLARLVLVSCIHNWDPNNRSIFGDAEFSYYNVVLYTDASQSEFLDYYKGIFDEEIVDEFPMSDMVKGYVGKYRVTASHYDSDSTGYIQVYFPKEEVSRENVYFDMYPDLFEEDGLFVEHENSYGLLNQVGGQTEYTRYFTVSDSGDQDNDGKDDVDEFGVLISKYKVLYSGKEGYEFDESTGLMKWNEDEYGVVVSFSRDHGRIYLNMRGSMRR
jgi:hypothetical protein